MTAPDKIWATEDAENFGHVILDEDLENYNYGRMISSRIQEREVE